MVDCNPNYANFKGVSDFGETGLLTELENNIKHYLEWSFLDIGAWTNVAIDTSNATQDGYTGQVDTLRWVSDPSYTDGQVWQSARKDWVYESGVNFDPGSGPVNPNATPQVYTSSNSVWSGPVADSAYSINYPLGRVIFDTPHDTDESVKASYSYRNVQVYIADNAEWWRELQLRSWRSDDLHFTQDDRTGDWAVGAHERIQLPAIVIEAVPRGRSRGYELGNTSLWIEQDVVLHILADDRPTRNKIVSLLQVQADHTIWLFDSDIVAASGAFPLDYSGDRVNGNVYPDIVVNTDYRWKKCTFRNVVVSDVEAMHPRLYEGTVRITCEFVFGNA